VIWRELARKLLCRAGLDTRVYEGREIQQPEEVQERVGMPEVAMISTPQKGH